MFFPIPPSFYTPSFLFLYLLISSLYCPYLHFLCPDTHSPSMFLCPAAPTYAHFAYSYSFLSPFCFFEFPLFIYIGPSLRGSQSFGDYLFVCLCSIYPSFPRTPTLWPVSPTYIAMCLEKTAVYLHGSFPCMCFIVDFLRVSGLKRYGF